jgi:hypothetical protein
MNCMCLTQFLKIRFFAHFCMSDQGEMRKGKSTRFFRNEGEGWILIARLMMRSREGRKSGALTWMDHKLPSAGRNVQEGQSMIARLCKAALQTFEELQERGSWIATRIQLKVFQYVLQNNWAAPCTELLLFYCKAHKVSTHRKYNVHEPVYPVIWLAFLSTIGFRLYFVPGVHIKSRHDNFNYV